MSDQIQVHLIDQEKVMLVSKRNNCSISKTRVTNK